MKLVAAKIAAAINKIIPIVPDIIFVKKSNAITAAITILIIRSADPIFFFILFVGVEHAVKPNLACEIEFLLFP